MEEKIERLKKLEQAEFELEMADRWEDEDYRIIREIREEIKEIKEILKNANIELG